MSSAEEWSGPLPDDVRARAVALASQTLGALATDEIPQRLRPVARFAAAKRPRLGASHLAAAMDNDAGFRARVVARAREDAPDLVEALEAGHAPEAADPAEVAAVAWVLAVPGWGEYVRLAKDARAEHGATGSDGLAALERLRDQLSQARGQARADVAQARAQVDEVRAELTAARREIRELKGGSRAAERRVEEVVAAAEGSTAEAKRLVGTAEAEARRLRARVAEAEGAVEAARRAAREGRSADDVRLRLLLDTVLEAAQGLRRELALPPVPEGGRPADGVDAGLAQTGVGTPGGTDVRTRGLDHDDPGLLDQLLALPQVHLVVDGYNVTKTGYAALPLDAQRARLTKRLGALAAQTGAEVTVVFDGATLDAPAPNAPPRGVRVLFSPAGTTADTVIRRVVRAEPVGRPVVVVSSDKEVADGVRAAGARAIPASGLLRRLDRS